MARGGNRNTAFDMKILIDMNLSPDWVHVLTSHNIEAIHWSQVGIPQAKDIELIEYARSEGFVIFTHDLDFGAILALTQAESPSVIQLRSQDILPENNTSLIVKHLEKYQDHLEEGALVVIDKNRSRVRILPLRR